MKQGFTTVHDYLEPQCMHIAAGAAVAGSVAGQFLLLLIEGIEEEEKFFSRYLANIIRSKCFAVFLHIQKYCISLKL